MMTAEESPIGIFQIYNKKLEIIGPDIPASIGFFV